MTNIIINMSNPTDVPITALNPVNRLDTILGSVSVGF